MVNVMGEKRTKAFLKKAIFSLTTGSNDMLNYVQPSIPFLGGDKVSPSTLQDYMVFNLTTQLKVRTYKLEEHGDISSSSWDIRIVFLFFYFCYVWLYHL